jgi:hypothetical protein
MIPPDHVINPLPANQNVKREICANQITARQGVSNHKSYPYNDVLQVERSAYVHFSQRLPYIAAFSTSSSFEIDVFNFATITAGSWISMWGEITKKGSNFELESSVNQQTGINFRSYTVIPSEKYARKTE